ncbi:MAG TPA: Rrf2 family transcriptional regulator [Chloroflexota bacterium]|nr:Rrf2 family transcriptional regulator [Chloroflexota bacterium]
MKSEYGLRAMMELALAYGGRPLQTADIAARRAIPESYLEQLLTTLRKAGFVSSVRGPQGGHTLAVHPSTITAGDVVRALEGPVVVVDAMEGTTAGQSTSPTVLRELWGRVRTAIDSALDGVTVEELAARQAAEEGSINYSI